MDASGDNHDIATLTGWRYSVDAGSDVANTITDANYASQTDFTYGTRTVAVGNVYFNTMNSLWWDALDTATVTFDVVLYTATNAQGWVQIGATDDAAVNIFRLTEVEGGIWSVVHGNADMSTDITQNGLSVVAQEVSGSWVAVTFDYLFVDADNDNAPVPAVDTQYAIGFSATSATITPTNYALYTTDTNTGGVE